MAYSIKPIIEETGSSADVAKTLFAGDTSAIIDEMRSGTPASVIRDVANRFGITQDSLFVHLRLPRNTLRERISKNALLSSTEQDRIYRADRVWKRTLDVLEDENSARRWITRSNRALGGESPLSLLDTEVGYELVMDTLGRIEHGVVA
ncbi:antitoxin [Massilia violaceinigra]|uniref:Antitoxin n=1 Tax=Massilia violaceinigra TaxID=2045208 RepID=A0A2D2DLP0_9BURK|nr:antitoxin Xre/MbcA/ParS toxin-binding domain-containing protein [Massilia violaceinigra]ATQ75880.1 antitoxin [Massilia violaceinigra]